MIQRGMFGNDIDLMIQSIKNANIPYGTLRPFINWVGGKTKLLPQIMPYVPAEFGTYYEPFLGGGAMFWRLSAEGRISSAVLSDIMPDLILAYHAVKWNPDGLNTLLRMHAKQDSRAYYYHVLTQPMDDPLEMGARIIYLATKAYRSKITWDGYRLFSSGYAGKRRIPDNKWNGVLHQCSMALQGVDILAQNYRAINPQAGDLVYFDPPYDESGISYGQKWARASLLVLRDFMLGLVERGVQVMMSNRDTEYVRHIFTDPFTTHSIISTSNMGGKSGYAPMSEILITG